VNRPRGREGVGEPSFMRNDEESGVIQAQKESACLEKTKVKTE